MSRQSKENSSHNYDLLPTDIRNRLPSSKLSVYFNSFDQALEEGSDKQEAHRKAWAKLRRKAPEVFLRERKNNGPPISWQH